jgi:hypothetical protein
MTDVLAERVRKIGAGPIGLSSSSQNATYRARQTAAQSRKPKSSGAPADFTASVNSRALRIALDRYGGPLPRDRPRP